MPKTCPRWYRQPRSWRCSLGGDEGIRPLGTRRVLSTDVIGQDALDAARRGEAEGLEFLFHELATPLATFADRRGATDPEGLANATLFRAFNALAGFDGEYPQFCSYVYRTARNLLIDEYRRKTRRPEVVDLAAAGPSISLSQTEDEVAGQDWLNQMLAQLTVDQRDVILLRVIGDQSLQHTADVLGKPVSAVKALQRRALRRLHTLTEEEGHTCTH